MRAFRICVLGTVLLALVLSGSPAIALEQDAAPSVSPFSLIYDFVTEALMQALDDSFDPILSAPLADGSGGEEVECVDGFTPEGEPCDEAGPVADPNG